ncbi:Cytosolic phospholipase A2 delta [Tritrichomonas musculus]|uniref:Cytosolic phospholipase A2 delta n=1 Tax=Tritrichomonas musculus TaxID=1915356 RepID=A0ABR2HVX0_9EUKA
MRLDVNVIGAKNLPKLNPKLPQKPYCVVQILDIDTHFQTKISTNPTNPEWNETFTFTGLSDSPITISFTVYNKEKVISSNNYDLSNITPGAEFNDWFDLAPEIKSKNKQKSGGKIHFSLLFTAEQEDNKDIIEEEEEDKIDSNPMTPRSSPQQSQFLSSGSPLSPRMKGDRTRKKILNDEGDIEQVENEAKETAEQKYNLFLRTAAPGLLDNSKVVEKMRENQEE